MWLAEDDSSHDLSLSRKAFHCKPTLSQSGPALLLSFFYLLRLFVRQSDLSGLAVTSQPMPLLPSTTSGGCTPKLRSSESSARMQCYSSLGFVTWRIRARRSRGHGPGVASSGALGCIPARGSTGPSHVSSSARSSLPCLRSSSFQVRAIVEQLGLFAILTSNRSFSFARVEPHRTKL